MDATELQACSGLADFTGRKPEWLKDFFVLTQFATALVPLAQFVQLTVLSPCASRARWSSPHPDYCYPGKH